MKNQLSFRKKGLNILIVGCGKVGAALVEQLVKEKHDVTIIDKNPEKIRNFTNLYDIMGVAGNGASFSVQREAGIDNADLLIAVTGSDELNLLCCTIAKQSANCAAIARVRTPDYSAEINYLREQLGLAMIINPDLEVAKEITRILCVPTALEVNSFAHEQAELIKIQIPQGNYLDGKSIAAISKNINAKFLICVIENEGSISIPSGGTILHSGDKISIIATRPEVIKFFKQIGFTTHQVKNTMIIGGGKTAYYLAYLLTGMGISVKMIEQNKARCEELSILLPKATIINGDGTNEDLLKEEGIETCESLIPLTGLDEENAFLTLYAKQVSNAKVITKINRSTFSSVIHSFDLGSVMYPRYITTEAIIAYVRAKQNSAGSNIETLYHMFDSQVEAIEFHIQNSSSITNVPLKDLSLKDNLLIACISRNGKLIFPSGQDTIKTGDSVMIVTTNTGFYDIQDILKG